MDRLSKAFVVLAAVGIAVAVYHGYDEVTSYTGAGSTICNINNFLSCGTVFASGDTTFPPIPYGLPLYIYGLVWFPLMLYIGLRYTRTSGTLDGEKLVPVLMVGNVFTLYLWYLEIAVIHALCPVCIGLYLLNYLMTIVAVFALLGQHPT